MSSLTRKRRLGAPSLAPREQDCGHAVDKLGECPPQLSSATVGGTLHSVPQFPHLCDKLAG